MFSRLAAHARTNSNVWIFGTMAVSALLSLLAAFVLSSEAFELLKNPNTVLSCSVNVIINCASVMKHPTSELFGFPNSFLGLMTEPVVLTVAIAGLSGIKFPRPFMAAAQVGYLAGLVFAYYLFFTSVFVIGALCPWCLLVTLSTTLVFASLLHYNIRENNLYLSPQLNARLQRGIAKGYDKFITAIFLAILIFIVLIKYRAGLFG